MSGHEPFLIAHGTSGKATCACGWMGRMWRRPHLASVEWALHVADQDDNRLGTSNPEPAERATAIAHEGEQ